MSKVKKRITTDIMGDEEEERPKDEQEDFEDMAMEKAALDFAEGERLVKLYRYPGDLGGRPRFLGGLAREDFNEIFVMERFGGGKYFGRWRKKNGQYTRFNFEIEGESKVLTRAAEQTQAEEHEEGEAYPYLNRGEQAQGSDKLNMIDVMRMMAESRKEGREEMRMLVEMMRPAQQAPDATEKVFSLVEKLAPLISQGGGEGGNPWLMALSQLKDPIMKAIDTIHTAVVRGPLPAPAPGAALRPNPAQPVVTAHPHAATPEPQPVVDVTPPTEGDMIADSFKDYLPMLVKAAAEKKDPNLYCDLVLDQVPTFAYDRLRSWLLKAGCLDDLAKHAPIIAADPIQRLWWEELRRLLIDSLNEEIGDAPRNLQPEFDSNPSTASSADSAQLSG